MRRLAWLLCALLIGACGDESSAPDAATDAAFDSGSDSGSDSGMASATDITDADFSNRSGDCADYARSTVASVTDLQRATDFQSEVEIVAGTSTCVLTSNAIPNHDFGDASAAFATPTAEIA